jgi:carbonic anhydrase/acetyltransferase-like protein (isoleucine patch superfamily)
MLYQFDGKQPQVEIGTDVSELAHVIGDVIIGDHCYIDLAAKYLEQGLIPVA